MNGEFDALLDLTTRHNKLADSTVRFRKGVVTAANPLSVALGGSDVPLTGLRVANGASPAVGDIVAVLSWGNDRLVLGTITDRWRPTWQTPALSAGWSSFRAALDFPVAYAKAPSGLVTVRGMLVKSSLPSSFETAFTLPTGYRPGTPRNFPSTVGANKAASRIQVNTDGTARIGEVPTGTVATDFWTLDGISFWAEA